jgi:hypothetical protein
MEAIASAQMIAGCVWGIDKKPLEFLLSLREITELNEDAGLAIIVVWLIKMGSLGSTSLFISFARILFFGKIIYRES